MGDGSARVLRVGKGEKMASLAASLLFSLLFSLCSRVRERETVLVSVEKRGRHKSHKLGSLVFCVGWSVLSGGERRESRVRTERDRPAPPFIPSSLLSQQRALLPPPHASPSAVTPHSTNTQFIQPLLIFSLLKTCFFT